MTAPKKKAVAVAVAAATPATNAAELAKQAYITSAHAHLATLKAAIGSTLYVGNYITGARNSGPADRLGMPLPAGCNLTPASVRRNYYGENVTLLGIDADGNVAVRSVQDERAVVQVLPYNFVRAADQATTSEARRANLKLNDSYTGTVLGDGSNIAVGCQRFKTAKLRELLDLAEKTRATVAAAPAPAQAFNLATRAATYTPAPKAAKVVAKKAVAKKAATKR